ncbi:MAG TPA: DUF72 domain-containing protein [Gemmatimonadaceae bacterium]|nr:DUF72 domain-containing protein [Gemmatimonadaceae bacterium]
MNIRAGTSGFAFKEWKGVFYPEGTKDAGMLAYYASRFPSVEINNTFYRLPKESVLADWASQVPDGFTFTIKASQRITHFARLKPESAELVDYLVKATAVMGDRLGAVLFQLPPNMKRDIERLQGFVSRLPKDRRFAIEFRHESWFDEAVISTLRDHDVAMVGIEQADFTSPVHSTASWGYLRLHRFDYSPEMLAEWARRMRTSGWTDAYVFFKHDHVPDSEGSGPLAVESFSRVCAIP